ncbi:hypothetical protein NQ317_019440 [Molorchus minor]|uniref:Uncharacterized protein n=1 Tax=Molorchus minor TaxID=1323400 RepID=A0ABQ9K1Y3_9CUCU|nr:hypothetical protein NQ317_019440 [Molorchus minor]
MEMRPDICLKQLKKQKPALPATSDASLQHIKRCQFQVCVAHCRYADLLDPKEKRKRWSRMVLC